MGRSRSGAPLYRLAWPGALVLAHLLGVLHEEDGVLHDAHAREQEADHGEEVERLARHDETENGAAGARAAGS